MYRLKNQDFRDIVDLIRISSSHFELAGMRQDMLHAMVRVFRIQSANFFPEYNPSRRIGVTDVVNVGINERYVAQYLEYYYCHDPFRAELHSRKVVCKSDDLRPYSCWMNLEYYNDFLKPQKMHHILGIYLRSKEKLLGAIGLYRPKEHPAFSEREVLMSHILVPHLTTAIENIGLLSEIEDERNILSRINDSLSLGILVLDFKLQPVYWNSRAAECCLLLSRKQLGGSGGVNGGDVSIPPEIVQDCLAIKELFESGNQIAPLRRQTTMYAGQTKKFKIISRLAQQPFQKASAPQFLVSLEDTFETYKMREEAMQAKYHLTKREMEIVRCVFEGLTNKDMAQKLFISECTVARHLQNIFEKTGAKNRTELATQIQPA